MRRQLTLLAALALVFLRPAHSQTSTPPACASEGAALSIEAGVLDVAASGFTSASSFDVVVHMPNRFTLQGATLYPGASPASESVSQSPSLGLRDASTGVPTGLVNGVASSCFTELKVTNTDWTDTVTNALVTEDPSNPDFHELIFALAVHSTEEVANDPSRPPVTPRPTREHRLDYPFTVLYPRSVVASIGGVNVADQIPTVGATLLGQDVDLRFESSLQDPLLTLELLVQINAPYQLCRAEPEDVASGLCHGGPTLTTPSFMQQIGAQTFTAPTACATVNGKCQRIFKASVPFALDGPEGRVCELDSTGYVITTYFRCDSSIPTADCPINPAENTVTFTLTLNSANFCPNIVDKVTLTASLLSYRDSARTQPDLNFVLGDTIYFRAQSGAVGASVDATVLRKVTIHKDGVSTVLYELPGGSTAVASNFLVNTGQPVNQAEFSWEIAGAFFTPPVDSFTSWSVEIILDVTYVDPLAPLLLGAGGSGDDAVQTRLNVRVSQLPQKSDSDSETGAGSSLSPRVAQTAFALVGLVLLLRTFQ